MFGSGKILLLNEFIEIIKKNEFLNLINIFWEYLENIKLFSNYYFYSNIIDNNFHLIIKKIELLCKDKEKKLKFLLKIFLKLILKVLKKKTMIILLNLVVIMIMKKI